MSCLDPKNCGGPAGAERHVVSMSANSEPLLSFLTEVQSLLDALSDRVRDLVTKFLFARLDDGRLFSAQGKSDRTPGGCFVLSIGPSQLGLELLAAMRAGEVEQFALGFSDQVEVPHV